MRPLPSRLRRLDGALADLPLDEPMLLTELDGFLTGIIVSPEPIARAEWMQNIWGSDEGGVPPFEDPLDVQWFGDAVMAHHAGIVRAIARGKLQPIFDIDERNGDVLWEPWLDAFAEAMEMRADAWDALRAGDDTTVTDALARLTTLIAVAREDSELDSIEINAIEGEAPAVIDDMVRRLASALPPRDEPPATTVSAPPIKIGRNEPCPCGSGRKSKRCCG